MESMEFETKFVDHGGLRLPQVTMSVLDFESAPSGQLGRRLPMARIISPEQGVFQKQLAKVLVWAELREERAAEILTQIDNQYCFWGAIVSVHTDRLRHTKELIDAAVQMSVLVEMRFKHELACWRPADYSFQVQPMITTPGHGSLPSGHCTQSYVVYEVLKALLNTMREGDAYRSVNRQFHRLAQRIATNRVVAGVHFPVDNVAGRILGKVLGEYFVYLCGYKWKGWKDRSGTRVKPWHYGEFDGRKFDGDLEFDPVTQPVCPPERRPRFYKYEEPKTGGGRAVSLPATGTRRAPILKKLFEKAQEECTELGLPF
jgi:membrane-associated phospholipid phosphatase